KIQGPAGGLTIDGNGARVFKVDSLASVAISGLTLTGGGGFENNSGVSGFPPFDGYGGGILNEGALPLTACVRAHNDANIGGGVANVGTMTLNRCTVSDNLAIQNGGGIYNEGTMTILSSTVSQNHSATPGTHNNVYNIGHLTTKRSKIQKN